jgi:hypothetical protein
LALPSASPSASSQNGTVRVSERAYSTLGTLEQLDAKGAVNRKYLPRYTSEDPATFSFSSTPTTPYGVQRYDAFGRQLQTFDVDGTVTLQSR